MRCRLLLGKDQHQQREDNLPIVQDWQETCLRCHEESGESLLADDVDCYLREAMRNRDVSCSSSKLFEITPTASAFDDARPSGTATATAGSTSASAGADTNATVAAAFFEEPDDNNENGDDDDDDGNKRLAAWTGIFPIFNEAYPSMKRASSYDDIPPRQSRGEDKEEDISALIPRSPSCTCSPISSARNSW